jgi:hypothetical protein
LDFESQYLKVLCLTDSETVRGLQWALDRQSYSGRRYRLFASSLAQIGASIPDFDIAIIAVDLGQPVPAENLKKLAGHPGVCAFNQPTPQQLLTLGELPNWSPIAWDGVSFDKLVERIDQVAERFEGEIKTHEFLRACRTWTQRSREMPGAVEWLNAPESAPGPRHFYLDTHKGFLSIGASNSKSDLRLPIPGTREVGELRYTNGVWMFKKSVEDLQVEIKSSTRDLKPGDQIEIESFVLQLRMHEKIEEFIALARRMGFDLQSGPSFLKGAAEKTLADICKELLYAGMTGELRLNAGLKSGSIYFWDGTIHYAITGAVSGLKALLRMMGWEKPSWRLNLGRKGEFDDDILRLSLQDFTRVHQRWRSAWTKVHALTPPAQVHLKAVPNNFMAKLEWTPHECQVMASICEYGLVRDVMNNCPLTDVEILETLIGMRRQSLIEPVKAPQASTH